MRRPLVDKATGDPLSRSDWVSLQGQSLIRRWPFIVLFTVATATLWVVGSPAVLSWWNYSASYLAILIESVVGIGMFSSGRRDAIIIREIREITWRLESLTELIHDQQLRQEK